MTEVTWSTAWRRSAREFWARTTPGDHFATSAGDVLADAMAEVVRAVDDRLGAPADFTVIDIGAADGAFLASVRERCAELANRARWVAVDVREGFVPGVEGVAAEMPDDVPGTPIRGVVMAHEWLDEIPVDIVERDADGLDRLVLVGTAGAERLGPSLDDEVACARVGVDAAATREWMRRWWPLRDPGDRAEVGLARDAAWSWMTGLVRQGLALAVDYGHCRPERLDALRGGTLTGYRGGRVVAPMPDGTVGITAHVAVDACQAAVPRTTLTWQRDEVASASLPDRASPADVERYFAAQRLRQTAGLGGFAWLRWEA